MDSEDRRDRYAFDSQVEGPERLLIAAELSRSARSAAQVAEATGMPLGQVRRHLREMREEGLIETFMTKSTRGTVERFYLFAGGLNAGPADYAKLSLDERRRFLGNLLTIILTEASRALVTHPTNRGLERLDSEILRTPVLTDEVGWKELGDLHREFCDRVLAIRERIEERLQENGSEDAFKASSVIMFFESERAD